MGSMGREAHVQFRDAPVSFSPTKRIKRTRLASNETSPMGCECGFWQIQKGNTDAWQQVARTGCYFNDTTGSWHVFLNGIEVQERTSEIPGAGKGMFLISAQQIFSWQSGKDQVLMTLLPSTDDAAEGVERTYVCLSEHAEDLESWLDTIMAPYEQVYKIVSKPGVEDIRSCQEQGLTAHPDDMLLIEEQTKAESVQPNSRRSSRVRNRRPKPGEEEMHVIRTHIVPNANVGLTVFTLCGPREITSGKHAGEARNLVVRVNDWTFGIDPKADNYAEMKAKNNCEFLLGVRDPSAPRLPLWIPASDPQKGFIPTISVSTMGCVQNLVWKGKPSDLQPGCELYVSYTS